jgi:hypothetical protein
MRARIVLSLSLLAGCGGPSGPGGGPGDPPVVPEPEPLVAPADTVRRLSASWYDHTVQDLFPGAVIPAQGLPVDPESHGFDNQAIAQVPSALVVEAWLGAANRVAAAAWETPSWLPCAPDGGADPESCAAAFVEDFGRRAFRRPLSADEQAGFEELLLEVYAEDGDYGAAVQVTIQTVLMSPDFLFLPEVGEAAPGERVPLDPYALAARLSYLLWAGPPDDELLNAAASGALDTADGVEAQARRLADDPRSRRAVAEFHRSWLDVDRLGRSAPDPATYPQWDEALRGAMRDELESFVERVVFDGEGTLAALLLDPSFAGDPALAAVYGVAPDAGVLPAAERAGVLTRAGWLTATSHAVNPSPVKRGIFVLERLLCDPPPPPPPDIDTSVTEVGAGDPRTNRERYEAHLTNPVCASCHLSIDGIGMGLEHYDAIGSFRERDGGFAVDATSELASGDLDGVTYDGALELSRLLADSPDVHGCYTTQWLRYGLGRTEVTGDDAELAPLAASFYASGGDVRELLVGLARTETFRTRAFGVSP